MTSLTPYEPGALVETAQAIGEVIKATPGLRDAIYETLQLVWTDPIKFSRRKRNLEHEFQLAEQMIKGKTRLQDISTEEAARVLEASMTEDREELQKIWAAVIARLITGELPTVRREWIEIIRGLEVVDVGVLELLPKVRNASGDGSSAGFVKAFYGEFVLRWPRSKLKNNDFWLSFKSLETKGLLDHENFCDKKPDGSWTPAWKYTLLGHKIVEITTPPATE